jgi:anaerobic dimethyl sulfoxide reductase subunit B (iron-sulfur subunit)
MELSIQFKTGVQYGFFFDQSRCHGCNICQVACKSWNMLPPGPGKMLRILQWEKGTFPNVRERVLFAPCYQCENPICVEASDGGLIKEPEYGAILVDPAKATSAALRNAWSVCPYGAIAFDSDAPNSKAVVCNFCIDRLKQNLYPVCVMSCPQRALDFGTMSDMKSKYGTNQQLEDMPDPSVVKPAIVFKPFNARKSLVPYDATKALTLLAKRDPLPPIFTDPSQVTNVPDGVTQNKPVFFAKSAKEFMVATTDNTA